MTGETGITPTELADYVANLSPGCALWRATGGPLAWSDETHMLAAVEFRLRVLAWQKSEDGRKNRNQPKPINPPESVYKKRAQQQRVASKAEAFQRRAGG
jgi:hypothetical protein